jgi:hypothetical protein
MPGVWNEAARTAALKSVAWAFVGLLGVLLLPWDGGASAGRPALSFEGYGNLSDVDAVEEFAANLDRDFRAGTPIAVVAETLEGAGARCRELRRHPGFVYCTYKHAAPGLASSYLRMEWKILLWYGMDRDQLTFAEIHRDSMAY